MNAVLGRQLHIIDDDFSLLKRQIEDTGFKGHTFPMLSFLMREGIGSLDEIDYQIRKDYAAYVEGQNYKIPSYYVSTFDRVVISHKKKQSFDVVGKPAFQYKDNIRVFLLYEARVDRIDYLYSMKDKETLYWDFTYPCPKELKKQIADVLSSMLEDLNDEIELKWKRNHIATLKMLYEFCSKFHIDDLMKLDEYEANQFKIYVKEKRSYFEQYAMAVIKYCRRILFLNNSEVCWDANVWYTERFKLDESRVNESNTVVTLSFLNIDNTDNKHILQEYIKYLIGLTDLSMSTIRTIKYRIEEFILHIGNKSVLEVTPYDIDKYIESQFQKGNNKEFIDRKLILINELYKNLSSYEYIDELPFQIDYYITTSFESSHSDRSVDETIVMTILKNLGHCEETLRLMFLIQLCTGRRISEVCQVKAGKVKMDNEDYWICFYQPKMHEDVMVPIPRQLFILLKKYIDENTVKPNEYLFKSEIGGAYRAGTYQKRMITFCKSIGLYDTGYDFKSHDFRHTIATYLYENGTSIQVIRDFLGHKTDEMTKQYIDYVPREIEKKSRELFAKKHRELEM